MKKICAFIAAITSIVFTSDAQAPPIAWQKSLGGSGTDIAFAIQQMKDGGYIVAGYSNSVDDDVTGNHGADDYWIIKLDASGSIEWQKSLGGSGNDLAESVQQTSDGGFIVAGYSNSNDGDVSGNHGGNDCWVVKLDTLGDIEWQKSLGGSSNDAAFSIQQTTDSGFIIAGYSTSNDDDVSENHGLSDSWIVKLSVSGNIQWQKSLGGSGYDQANSIRQTFDGGFIVAGYSTSNDDDVSGNHGGDDFWVVKLDTSGNIQWQKSLGGSYNDVAFSVQQTSDSGYITAGFAYSIDGDVTDHHGKNSDDWVVKLSSSGNIIWQKALGGTGDEGARFIQQVTNGGYIVAGYSDSDDDDVSGNHGFNDDWIVQIDDFGNIQWQESLGGSNFDNAFSCALTSTGQITVAGNSLSTDGDVVGNHGGSDYWIVDLVQCNDSLTYYADQDSDGYGDAHHSVISTVCAPPSGYVLDSSDCNDTSATIHPGAAEICNNIDDNCNGSIDEGLILITYYADADSDGYGDANNSISACAPVPGYVTDSTDCNDSTASIYPGAPEVCNNLDDNCNGSIDEGLVFVTYYQDADSDGYGNASDSINACTPVSGYVTDSTDCNDSIASVHPGAPEVCNNLDDNCNGSIDEGLAFVTYYQDADSDGYGNASDSISACAPLPGYVTDSTDCDDTNPNVHPGAKEIVGNGIDDNCNGFIDEFGTGIFSIDKSESQLSIFPNPTNGTFNIELRSDHHITDKVTLEVINEFGQIILSQKTAMIEGKLLESIQIVNTTTGTYLVKIITTDQIYLKQIEIEKP